MNHIGKRINNDKMSLQEQLPGPAFPEHIKQDYSIQTVRINVTSV